MCLIFLALCTNMLELTPYGQWRWWQVCEQQPTLTGISASVDEIVYNERVSLDKDYVIQGCTVHVGSSSAVVGDCLNRPYLAGESRDQSPGGWSVSLCRGCSDYGMLCPGLRSTYLFYFAFPHMNQVPLLLFVIFKVGIDKHTGKPVLCLWELCSFQQYLMYPFTRFSK